MSEEEQLQLLSENGMLVKRPILVRGDTVLVQDLRKQNGQRSLI